MTPQELLAQSQEMLSLQGDYEDLFKQSETLLNRVNENWSATLANNFSGKILSAQKSFRQISTMLGSGGNLAAESARTYESVDSLLAKNINGDGGSVAGTIGAAVAAGAAGMAGAATGTAASGGDTIYINADGTLSTDSGLIRQMSSGSGRKTELSWESFLDYLVQDTKQSWETAGQALQEVSDWYGNLPEDKKNIYDALKDAFIPGQLESSYQITKDIVTGDVSWDTAKEAGKAILGGTKYQIVEDSFKYANEIMEVDQEYMQRTNEEAKKGNVLACLTNMAGSFIDEIGGGLAVVGGGMIGSTISKIPGVSLLEENFGFNVKESISSAVETGQKYVREGIKNTVDAVGKAEEKAKEFIGDTAKAVGKEAKKVWNAAGEGLGKAKDAVKGLFKW